MQHPRTPGRPRRTTPADVERVALQLFAGQGYERTTMEEVAAAAGIGRRTLFRYFPSKKDLVWGEFDSGLDVLAKRLAASDRDRPLFETLRAEILAFNALDPAIVALHKARMRLILRVPDLQAHGTLRYAQWRAVVASHVAARTGSDVHDLVPQTTAHAMLAACLTAYEVWLDGGADLQELLGSALDIVARGLRTVGPPAG